VNNARATLFIDNYHDVDLASAGLL
jgi:hypothetical protein